MNRILLCLGLAVGTSAAQSKLPDGPGKAVVERACKGCHGFEFIIRARNTRERWGEIVDDMVSRGAEGSDEEIDTVIDYLALNFSKRKVNVNKATAVELVTALGIPEADAGAIVRYRTDKGAFKEPGDVKNVSGIDAKKIDGWKDQLEFQ